MVQAPAEDRCEYVNDGRWGKHYCCWRESWENGRCVWHAEVSGKPTKAIKTALERLDSLEHTNRSTERLDGAVLRGMVLDDSISFEGCRLPDADFRDTDPPWGEYPELERPWATRTEQDVATPSFRGADLKGADFSNCDLPSTDFEKADCDGARMVDSGLAEATLDDASLEGANLTRAFLGGATLRRASVSEATFTEARLSSATLAAAFAERAVFHQADLSGADLRGAYLYSAVLSNVRVNESTTFGERTIYDHESPYYPPTVETDSSVRDFEASNLGKSMAVYRRLEELHDANAMSERARDYHIRKEETERRSHLQEGQFGLYGVATANRYLTRHGESLAQLLVASAILIIGSGILYPLVGGVEDGDVLYSIATVTQLLSAEGIETLARGLYFSIITFTTIGYANVAPVGPYARILVGIESLLGAIFVALFVFILGRRVAR